jgi:hypothetical protein
MAATYTRRTVANSCGATIPTPVSDPLGSNVLANNVGPTQTIALPAGSAAIDEGNDAVCAAAPVYGVDQRGVTRPQGPRCDIGAYELIQHPPTENCYYYEYTYTSLDNPEDSGPSCTELCFNYGDNSGTFAGLCNSFGNLVLFFDSMKKQALWYSTSTPSLGFLKFHGVGCMSSME